MLLRTGKPLPSKYKDHSLSGSYGKYRECHITQNTLSFRNTSKLGKMVREKSKLIANILNTSVLEYLSNFIKIAVNCKVRTLETRIIPNKKASDEAKIKNGRVVGVEPTNIGTTIRWLDHLPIPTMWYPRRDSDPRPTA